MNDPITSREAAKRADTTVSTINRWVQRGLLKPVLEIPGYRGARLFDPSDVERARENAS